MSKNLKSIVNDYLVDVFGSELDEDNIPYSEVYVHELQGISGLIADVFEDKYYEDELEVGIIIKHIFTNTFHDSINLDRKLYVKMGKEISKLYN